MYVKVDQVTPKLVSTTKISATRLALIGASAKPKTTGVAQRIASVTTTTTGVQP